MPVEAKRDARALFRLFVRLSSAAFPCLGSSCGLLVYFRTSPVTLQLGKAFAREKRVLDGLLFDFHEREKFVPSAPSRLKVGVAGFGVCWETSIHKEVSHEQEVHRTSFG